MADNYVAKDPQGLYWCGDHLGWVGCRTCAVRMRRLEAHARAHGVAGTVVRIVPRAAPRMSPEALADRARSLHVGRPGEKLNVRDVQHAVCSYFNIPVAAVTGRRRHKHLARVRNIAIYFARRYTSASSPEIGMAFGDRDHTTILSAHESIASKLDAEPELSAHVAAISDAIESSGHTRVFPRLNTPPAAPSKATS